MPASFELCRRAACVRLLYTVVILCTFSTRSRSMPTPSLVGPSGDIPCSWGATTTVSVVSLSPQSVDCGPAANTYRVMLVSGDNVKREEEVYLGELAAQDRLTLTVKPSASQYYASNNKLQRYQGVLRRSGTYKVQLTVTYANCPPVQAETQLTVSRCPAQATAAGFEVQECRDVKQPGSRHISLIMSAFDPDGNYPVKQQWQLLPSASLAGGTSSSSLQYSSSITLGGSWRLPTPSFSFGGDMQAGNAPTAAAAQLPAINCQATATAAESAAAAAAAAGSAAAKNTICTVAVGAIPGRLQPGQSYTPMYIVLNNIQQQQQQDSLQSWTSLDSLVVEKCPPRITMSSANLKGSCKGGERWLEMKVNAVDLEEGAAVPVKQYWYILSARTRNIVLQGTGKMWNVGIGTRSGELLPGRSYIVKVVVVAAAGGQVSSAKQEVGDVLTVGPCS